MTRPSAAIIRALHALGGRATLGDLIMATALARVDVEGGLEEAMADGRVQVSVSESSVVVYRLHERPSRSETPSSRRRSPGQGLDGTRPLDRKTLQLIRARGGVVSLAELVEHTGLTVTEAEVEARRLAALYGGEPHPSWDGHVVYAFADLVESAHGDFHVREPRPAWVRGDDPMAQEPDPRWRSPVLAAVGALGTGALAWLATFPPAPGGRALLLAAVAGASAGAAFAASRAVLRRIGRHPRIRLQRAETLRRYALGYIFETALKGKGVISLSRTVEYLRRRTGLRRIRRRKVERILRRLAEEFDAPVTKEGGDSFFGFRNVKRQFLASQVQRSRLGLERKASGRTVYDSGDSEVEAARRELDEFDRAMRLDARRRLQRPDPSRRA